MDLIESKKTQISILVKLIRVTTKKLKKTSRLTFCELRYTTVLKNDPSYFWKACPMIPKVAANERRL
jgi:hypothetical protein